MSDNTKQAPTVNSQNEILKEVSKRIEKKIASQGTAKSLLEALLVVGDEYIAVKSENENRKSSEQKANEAKEAEFRKRQIQLDESKKTTLKIDALFSQWIKRDTWLIYNEAMQLIMAKDPDKENILGFKDEKLWALVESCAGHSLQVLNRTSQPKQWRVKPFEWVRWLKEKEIHVHTQLLNQLYPKVNIVPTQKTAKANNSRELIKAQRLKSLRAFEANVLELARHKNIEWNKDAIPVTKEEFLEIFYKLNPAIKQISKDSFDRDIADIGIKFKRGTKSNRNNILKQLFSTQQILQNSTK